MKTAIVFLADGVEMCEALITVDILRRAGVEVITTSIHPDWFDDELDGQDEEFRVKTFEELRKVVSSHKVTILADASADELVDNEVFPLADALILPGGRTGAENIAKSPIAVAQIKEFAEKCVAENGNEPSRYLAAICAAPGILADLGILEGKEATIHPEFEEKLTDGGAILTHDSVTVSGNIITGQALGATFDFALELVKKLVSEDEAERVKKNIYYS